MTGGGVSKRKRKVALQFTHYWNTLHFSLLGLLTSIRRYGARLAGGGHCCWLQVLLLMMMVLLPAACSESKCRVALSKPCAPCICAP